MGGGEGEGEGEGSSPCRSHADQRGSRPRGSTQAPEAVGWVSCRTWSTRSGHGAGMPPRVHSAWPNVTWQRGGV